MTEGTGDDITTLSLWFNVLGLECDTGFDTSGGWAIYAAVILYTFFLLAKVCDDHLMEALELICNRLQLSPDVAGATFLALASSAPEIFTSLVTTFIVVSGGGVGCIAGSAIFNLLVIIGSVALVSKTELEIGWYPTVRDTVWNCLAMAELYLVLRDGIVEWWECVFMILTYAAFLVNMKKNEAIVCWLAKQGWQPDVAAPEGGGDQEQGDANAGKKQDSGVVVSAPEDNAKTASEAPEVAKKEGPTMFYIGDPLREAGQSCTPRNRDDAHAGVLGLAMAETLAEVQLEEVGEPAAELQTKKAEEISTGDGSESGGETPTTVAATNDLQQQQQSALQPASSGRIEIKLSSKSLGGILDENGQEINKVTSRAEELRAFIRSPVLGLIDATMPKEERLCFLRFMVCVLWITVITYFMVDTSNRLGCVMKMPPVAFGLIFVAAGTSVPDTIGSLAAARAGYGDMCCSNALGSTRINLTVGLGIPWLVRTIYTQRPILMGDQGSLLESLLLFVTSMAAYCVLLGLSKWRLRKLLGVSMLFVFGGYVAWVFARNYGLIEV